MQDNEKIETRIFSKLEVHDFIGRSDEVEAILRHAENPGETKGLLILSAPCCGLSELFAQCYDRLFADQGEVIPIYFSFSENLKTPEQFAKHFLQTILLQTVAFRRDDRTLLETAPEICEIAELAAPADSSWIDRLISACESSSRLKDERSFLRQALSAPMRAKANQADLFIMFDNLQNIEHIKGEINVLNELKDVYGRSGVPFVFGGFRRYVQNAMQSGNPKLNEVKTLKLNSLTQDNAVALVNNLARKTEVKTNPQAVDLLVQQFAKNPSLIQSLFLSAKENGVDLDSFNKIQQVYADSVLGGRIGRFYQTVFDSITREIKLQNRIFDLLANEDRKTAIETWQKHLSIEEDLFRKIINVLNIHEIIRFNSGMVEFNSENTSIADFVTVKYRSEVVGEGRALVVGNLLAESLKRAPKIMTRFYRRSTAIGLRELLSVFNCQEISRGLIDYEIFKSKYKGETRRDDYCGIGKRRRESKTSADSLYGELCIFLFADRSIYRR